ncbi:GNAT family N-acetyltransferase [Alkalicoccobacillus porphyridii]|uniref:Acetyltransferase n=1 Tax=Alkalicoccobacillus porphyridii TaxID=2597270 RepID=A0A553ZW20_9BACI|nr:GNAT family N-acetyltransferase [Alkalicoccobacillus porphyridii]TSB45535.1 acetyltransferase [Alkalicoccobacillus porphyridii]
MNPLIKREQLNVRPLVKEDAYRLTKWLSDPEVLQFYEGRDHPFDLEMVQRKFYKQTDRTNRCAVEWEGQTIGYVQYYPIDEEERKTYGLMDNKSLIYGLDQFIGEKDFWNKGIGTILVQTMTDFLTIELKVEQVVMDPQVTNTRALACYEKCGFVKQKRLPEHEWHEGQYRDCWLIIYTPNQKSEQ